jgi:hypothetical protein
VCAVLGVAMVRRANGLIALCHCGMCTELFFLLMKNVPRHILKKEQAKNMKLLLTVFELMSGLNINFHKSEIFYYS